MKNKTIENKSIIGSVYKYVDGKDYMICRVISPSLRSENRFLTKTLESTFRPFPPGDVCEWNFEYWTEVKDYNEKQDD